MVDIVYARAEKNGEKKNESAIIHICVHTFCHVVIRILLLCLQKANVMT